MKIFAPIFLCPFSEILIVNMVDIICFPYFSLLYFYLNFHTAEARKRKEDLKGKTGKQVTHDFAIIVLFGFSFVGDERKLLEGWGMMVTIIVTFVVVFSQTAAALCVDHSKLIVGH